MILRMSHKQLLAGLMLLLVMDLLLALAGTPLSGATSAQAAPICPSSGPWLAKWRSQFPNPTLAQGGQTTLSVSFDNIGSSTLPAGGADVVGIFRMDEPASVNDFAKFTYPGLSGFYNTRVAKLISPTSPGATGSFSFTIQAPANLAPGTYRIDLGLARGGETGGGTWIESNGSGNGVDCGARVWFEITVVAPSLSSISGYVRDSGGAGINGVSISFTGGRPPVTTDSSGFYSQSGFANGSYTVTPSQSGYSFTPASRSVTVSGVSQSGLDFIGTPTLSPTPTSWQAAWKSQNPSGINNPVLLSDVDGQQHVHLVFTNRSNGVVSNTGPNAIGIYVRQTAATRPPPAHFGDGAFACTRWLSPYHPINMAESSVVPGSEMTFDFDLCVNSVAPGINYRIDFSLAHGTEFIETVGANIATAWFPVRVVTAVPSAPQIGVSESVQVRSGQGFRFDASDSFDPDGGEITRYLWQLVRDPAGNPTNVVLSDTASPVYNPATTPGSMNETGTWTLRLIITDDEGATAMIERTVHIDDISQFDVPFFSQRDRQWASNKMRCGITLSSSGCLITSSAMVFSFFGVDIDPGRLNSQGVTDSTHCFYQWPKSIAGTSFTLQKERFQSYSRLGDLLRKGPVILGVAHVGSGAEPDHWIVVISGSGNDPANYRANDPWMLTESAGENRPLKDILRTYPRSLSVAAYRPMSQIVSQLRLGDLQAPAVAEPTNFEPADAPFAGLAAINSLNYAEETLAVLLNVTSTNGRITRMQISTKPDLSDARWVAYEPSISMSMADTIYMRFADESGVISHIVTDSLGSPNRDPLTASQSTLFLPLVVRNP